MEAYLGNPNLKRVNVPQEFSEENIIEYNKCSNDPLYFIENFVRIVSLDHGLVPFDMYNFQRDMVNSMHNNRFTIHKLPRQSGKSTIIISYLLHFVLFNPSVSVAVLANKSATARDILGRLQLAYENLPKWMQQGVLVWNKGSLELENGSKILAASTSASAVRGGSYNVIFLDEFAFIPNHIADQFFASVYPTISSGQKTKVIIVNNQLKISIVGTNGIPSKYGGFETLVEFLVEYLSNRYHLTVFCSSRTNNSKLKEFNGCQLEYINLNANGWQSILYDFLSIYRSRKFDKVIILGASGGLLMPFFVFINTFTLGRIVRELQKINKYLELMEQRGRREILGQHPRPND